MEFPLKQFWRWNFKPIKIAIVGNCQARPMAQIIATLCSNIEVVTIAIVHLLKNEEKKNFDRSFQIADFIFAQRVADNYPCTFVRTDDLKNKYGKKVIVWPNIFYRGYNPELIYLRNVDRQPLAGPLGDYHNQTFVEGWKNGIGTEETLKLHRSIDYNRDKYGNVPSDSLAELSMRETDCDITISKYIEKRLNRSRLFFTFNHPTLELLVYVAKALVDHVGIRHQQFRLPDNSEPLGLVQPPPNPWVRQHYGLVHNGTQGWKGLRVDGINLNTVKLGSGQLYNDEEIINIFFQIYSANKSIL